MQTRPLSQLIDISALAQRLECSGDLLKEWSRTVSWKLWEPMYSSWGCHVDPLLEAPLDQPWKPGRGLCPW